MSRVMGQRADTGGYKWIMNAIMIYILPCNGDSSSESAES